VLTAWSAAGIFGPVLIGKRIEGGGGLAVNGFRLAGTTASVPSIQRCAFQRRHAHLKVSMHVRPPSRDA
jgi:hypothetical protein